MHNNRNYQGERLLQWLWELLMSILQLLIMNTFVYKPCWCYSTVSVDISCGQYRALRGPIIDACLITNSNTTLVCHKCISVKESTQFFWNFNVRQNVCKCNELSFRVPHTPLSEPRRPGRRQRGTQALVNCAPWGVGIFARSDMDICTHVYVNLCNKILCEPI